MSGLCRWLAGTSSLICRSPIVVCAKLQQTSTLVCDTVATITQTICDATTTVTQTVCDATTTVTQTVCDATTTVTQKICDSWGSVPIIGGLVCLFSHVVSTVVCAASHVVATVVCTASHIVSTVVCAASHVVSQVVCIASHVVSAVVCVASHIVTTILCLVWTVIATGGCILVGGVGRLVCSFAPPAGRVTVPAMPAGNNYVENIVDGDNVLPRLLRDLSEATHDINISMFLFFNDPIGNEVGDLLIAKASDRKTPVAVRVLTSFSKTHSGDPFSTGEKEMMDEDPSFTGNPLDIDALARRLRAGGVEILTTDIDYDHVVPTTNATYRADAEAVRAVVNVDSWHVDHRKIVTIDGRVGYVGSANIGAQYLYHLPFDPTKKAHDEADAIIAAGGAEPWWKWHDGLARVEGPVVSVLEQVFKERWVLDGGADFAIPARAYTQTKPGVAGLRVVPSQPGFINGARELYLERIQGATTSIFIENAYMFHPDVVDALIRARVQHPDLRITLILPSGENNDNPIDQDAQEFRYQRYLPAGIAVFEYQNHFNHLKLATFDERFSILGSANLNYRSLEWDKDFELVIEVDDRALALEINAHVRDVDITHSRRITAGDLTVVTNTRNPATWAAEQLREI